jgi:simple sugar transport system substrate-binding protein
LFRRSASVGVIAVAALALAACSQSSSSSSSSSAAATEAASSAAATDAATDAAAAPAPFSDGPVNIALVRQSGAGDYFTAWGAGAQKQADAAGINLTVYDAQADNAKQATDFETAINSKPAAIILDHGLGDTVKPLVAKAVAANIPVIVYDADVAPGAGIVLTSQSDESMAESVLGIMATDLGSGAQVGYVSAKGFAPLDRRAVVWDAAVAKNSWKVDFSTGKVSASTATDTAPLVTAALQKNPGVQGIFAAYDELAKGTLVAIQNAKLADKVKELKASDGVVSGDLTEEGAKELAAFGRGGRPGGQAPEPKNAKGSVKYWLKEGQISKVQVKISSTVNIQGEDRNMTRTTTYELKAVGTTKVEVPEEAKKKIGA